MPRYPSARVTLASSACVAAHTSTATIHRRLRPITL
jgi:hypothetical protein